MARRRGLTRSVTPNELKGLIPGDNVIITFQGIEEYAVNILFFL
ncbi:hypothetical protein [Methanospirillum hungatei]|nr:hypothetical protein [Methanospirillum hungatei]